MAFAALPTAPSAYVLAVRMGGQGAFVAGLVTVSTLLCALSLPLWLAVLARCRHAELAQRPVDVLGQQLAGRGAGAARSAASIAASGAARSALPSATARLRCQRAWPMRRMALPSVRRRNSASSQAHSCSSVAPSKRVRARRSRAASQRRAYLFHGQTSWQSSQP